MSLRCGALALVLGCSGCAVPVPESQAPEAFLFAHFTGNGEDGMHLLGSLDGFRWQSLVGGNSVLRGTVGKEKLVRDPSVTLGPDGLYHVVWTCGWWENGIGYAATSDFVHWTAQRFLPVMAHEPTVRNTWAPEVTYDEVAEQYVIVWASTIPGRFPATDGSCEDGLDHRLYVTTTRDWRVFAPTRLLIDPGFSSIDGTFARTQAGQRYLLLKNESLRPPKKHLCAVPAASLLGPFGPVSEPFSPDWVEGPTALWNGEESVVYFDRYRDGGFGAVSTTDFVHFEDCTSRIVMPAGVRHGTAFSVPIRLLGSLQR
jgi:hypothetical protein